MTLAALPRLDSNQQPFGSLVALRIASQSRSLVALTWTDALTLNF